METGSLLTPSMFLQGSEGNLCCVWLSEFALFEMQSDPCLRCLFFRTAFRRCYPWMAGAMLAMWTKSGELPSKNGQIAWCKILKVGFAA